MWLSQWTQSYSFFKFIRVFKKSKTGAWWNRYVEAFTLFVQVFDLVFQGKVFWAQIGHLLRHLLQTPETETTPCRSDRHGRKQLHRHSKRCLQTSQLLMRNKLRKKHPDIDIALKPQPTPVFHYQTLVSRSANPAINSRPGTAVHCGHAEETHRIIFSRNKKLFSNDRKKLHQPISVENTHW